MNDGHPPFQTLQGSLDGVLPPAERAQLEAHLAACAACRQELRRWTALKRALREQLGQERAPASLRAAVAEQLRAGRRAHARGLPWFGRTFAVGLAAVLLIVAIGMALFPRSAPSILGELGAAHARIVADPRDVGIRGDRESVASWARRQLGQPVAIPASVALALSGARAETIAGRPAAHLVYTRSRASSLSLVIWRGSTPDASLARRKYEQKTFYVGQSGRQSVVLWPAGDLIYACVSETGTDDLLDIAADLWRQVQAAPAGGVLSYAVRPPYLLYRPDF